MLSNQQIYYVYVLFDHHGILRYVGKGHGNRWLEHEKYTDGNCNPKKDVFIRRTLNEIREIPKVKIREHLTEKQALEIENTFIKAIGVMDVCLSV